MHTFFKPTVLACVLTASVFSSWAQASGSSAVGSAKTGDNAIYGQGKRVFAVKVACDSCSMPGLKLNKGSAKELLQKIPEIKLSSEDAQALSFYLKRRYKL